MKNNLTVSTFLGALVIALGLLAIHEYYFRKIEGWSPGYDDNAELWSYWRSKVDNLSSEDVVIVGSSRSLFNINIHLFDSLTGHRPIMLSIGGGSPYYTFEDIVNKSNFNGLLIVGVAPGLFYTLGTGGGAMWIKTERVDFYYKQTYASKFSQAVYTYIDPHFAYLDPEISLKSLINRIQLPDRDSVDHALIWPPMVQMDHYRNIRMNPGMETDTVLQNWQTKIWDGDWKNHYVDSTEVILNHYSTLVNEFKKKGGRLAFVQSPVTGKYLQYEPVLFPREQYWNALLENSEATGYTYEDYPEMQAMIPPEWSHLNRKDADDFTRILIALLRKDGLLNP
jgi:hypothetical protein